LKATTSFTLSDVDELVQDQFAIAPAIGPNNNSMADGGAAGSISDDMGEPRGLSELLVVRQRNSIDHQHFHPGTIPNPDSMRIGRGSGRSEVCHSKCVLSVTPNAGAEGGDPRSQLSP